MKVVKIHDFEETTNLSIISTIKDSFIGEELHWMRS